MLVVTTLLLALAQEPVEKPRQAPRAVDVTPAGEPRERWARIAITSPQQPRQQRGFSATGILELEFSVALRSEIVSGDHLLELKLYTPRGHLYQVLSVPFTTAPHEPEEAPPPRPIDRQRRPVEVQQAHELMLAEFVHYAVGARLPVAGTWIVTNSLYGKWRVDAHLDGSSKPYARRHFRIVP